MFLAVFLLCSIWHFAMALGRMDGFDGTPYLDMYTKVTLGAPIPGVRALWESYNPPLAFWMADVLHRFATPVLASTKLFTMLCIVFTVLCLREALRILGVLWTVPGIAFLYTAAALPVYIFLSTEVGIDGAVLLWAAAILMMSLEIFYHPAEERSKRHRVLDAVSLTLMLAASVMTKFSGFIAFSIPWIVILACRHPVQIRNRALIKAAISCIAALLLIGPFYYQHYYRSEGTFVPVSMEWFGGKQLLVLREQRDKNPVGFLVRILRIPERSVQSLSRPLQDSVWSQIWFQTWKRDGFLQWGSPVVALVSNIEARIFFVVFYAGLFLFVFRYQKRDPWAIFGVILSGISCCYLLAIVKFGYDYPLLHWLVFKAKYVAPALLWIPFALALCTDTFLARLHSARIRNICTQALLFCVFLLLSVNYLLPVY